jgi:hypothetical protein
MEQDIFDARITNLTHYAVSSLEYQRKYEDCSPRNLVGRALATLGMRRSQARFDRDLRELISSFNGFWSSREARNEYSRMYGGDANGRIQGLQREYPILRYFIRNR